MASRDLPLQALIAVDRSGAGDGCTFRELLVLLGVESSSVTVVGVGASLAEHLAVVHLGLVMALRLMDVVDVSGDRFDVVLPPFMIVSASICPSALCLPKCR